ncbi:UNVERIFIED_ORG: hypothetical protein GGD51_000758 [Rhizobium esperanzae]
MQSKDGARFDTTPNRPRLGSPSAIFVFVDAPMRLGAVERQERLTERQPLKRRYTNLDQEVPTSFQMRGRV